MILDENGSLAGYVSIDLKDRDPGGYGQVTEADFFNATVEGVLKSLRPMLMAVSMNIFVLLPVMLGVGLGADVMKRISSPMFGGLIFLSLLTILVIPIIYQLYANRRIVRGLTP